ncbi:transmembrane emp24 domain-containing protein 6-like [Oppia nitens]|uniref:transmembrane emp24 domain-containing protein 6-like n=1 Tax=Oppia nitens TaxID=1686743 RepID=UPI0023DAA7AA|nr:transmembrane emp24 domain-containing protein 6-like [Oppia nitens]
MSVMVGKPNSTDFEIIGPNNQVLDKKQMTNDITLQHGVLVSGTYSFCIINTNYMFEPKLISIYLWAYQKDSWSQYAMAINEPLDKLANMSAHMQKTDTNIGVIYTHLERMKRETFKDWLLIISNNRYVQNWSLIQCVVIIVSTVTQVVFVRRLFGGNESKLKGRPQA